VSDPERGPSPINTDKIGSISELLGTVFEEISHIRDGLAGRQDKKVADDKSKSGIRHNASYFVYNMAT